MNNIDRHSPSQGGKNCTQCYNNENGNLYISETCWEPPEAHWSHHGQPTKVQDSYHKLLICLHSIKDDETKFPSKEDDPNRVAGRGRVSHLVPHLSPGVCLVLAVLLKHQGTAGCRSEPHARRALPLQLPRPPARVPREPPVPRFAYYHETLTVRIALPCQPSPSLGGL